MKFHLFHFTVHGIARAVSHVRAGCRLCKESNTSIRHYFPECVSSMTAAWNFLKTLDNLKLSKPHTIIDVGANCSQMTKLLQLCCDSNPTILSFEPNPALSPIGKMYNMALGSTDEPVAFVLSSEDDEWGHIQQEGSGDNGAHKTIKVEQHRFDTLVKDGRVIFSDLQKPIILKVDTEGGELNAIKGFGVYLNDIDYLLVEVENNESRGQHYGLAEIVSYLSELGFKNSKVLYACYDGPASPAYLDTLFWR